MSGYRINPISVRKKDFHKFFIYKLAKLLVPVYVINIIYSKVIYVAILVNMSTNHL